MARLMMLKVERGTPQEYLETETGKRFFSVTQIRRTACDPYIHVTPEILEAARRKGQLLHVRFGLVLLSRAGVCEHPASILGLEGYCLAMDEWAERNQVRPLRVEEPSLNRKLSYAGQPDTQCLYGPRQIVTLTDLKSGQETLTDYMQLLGYQELEGYQSKELLDLYVHEDGTYKEVWRKPNPYEWAGFLNALSLLKWRTSHGLGF